MEILCPFLFYPILLSNLYLAQTKTGHPVHDIILLIFVNFGIVIFIKVLVV